MEDCGYYLNGNLRVAGSDIQYPISYIQYPISNIQYLIIEDTVRTVRTYGTYGTYGTQCSDGTYNTYLSECTYGTVPYESKVQLLAIGVI